MKEGRIPFRKMAFVCVHERAGEAACANADRGEDSGANLVELLREEIHKRGLKGKIRVVKSGCLDVCAAGPNVMIFDGEGKAVYFSRVTAGDLPAIIAALVSG